MSTCSVVMATYNGARFVHEQLVSLAAQRTLPYELIVSDDGSTDETFDIVQAFATESPFPVILRKNDQNLGYGENFLRAAALATGDYIAFCDQDDIWDRDKLRLAVERLLSTNAELFVHAAHVVDAAGRRIGHFNQGIQRDDVVPPLRLPPWGVYHGCTMVFPRRLLTLIDPGERGLHTFEHDRPLSHDLWVYFLAVNLGTVALSTRKLISYRQHHSNVTPAVRQRGLRAWVRSLGLPADRKLGRDRIARQRAETLDELTTSALPKAIRRRAGLAADYWYRIAELEHARIQLYVENGLARRIGRIALILSKGGYRAFARGGLGGRLLAKDLLVGVVRARVSSIYSGCFSHGFFRKL